MSLFSEPHLYNSRRWKNRRVGLLGGSFNPPHEGHVHISIAALNGLELDAIWWLVTLKNPLKTQTPATLAERLQMSKNLVDHPKILVTDLESELNTQITYFTIRKLKNFFPQTHFVWISGMDNANSLHTWHHWQDLLDEICMVHLSRNPATSLIKKSPLKNYSRREHKYIDRAARYPLDSHVTYWMMQKKMVHASSTEIREKTNNNNILNKFDNAKV